MGTKTGILCLEVIYFVLMQVGEQANKKEASFHYYECILASK